MVAINFTNLTEPSYMLGVANEISSGYFWTVMLYMCFFIILIVLLARETKPEVAMLSSSFFGFVGGLFLAYAKLMNWSWVLFFLGVMVVTFLYATWSSTNDNLY